MTTLALHRERTALIKPEPRSPISIRLAVPGSQRDLDFIDALHKKHNKMVGFLPLSAIVKRIEKQQVLIAEEANEPRPSESGVGASLPDGRGSSGTPIGYCIFEDKYMKHEDVGICYHLNVEPGNQRGLVGAMLIKTAFEHCAYGTKLFCCWCAQDIEANHFWEAMGFVPLAYRAGSRGQAQGGRRKDQRIHIFWQRRIREGDEGVGATPYWYPSETHGGPMGEGRIALPIEPGTHWSDAKLIVLPGESGTDKPAQLPADDGQKVKRTRKSKPKVPKVAQPLSVTNGLRFAPTLTPPAPEPAKAEKPKREKRPRQKNDPKLVAAAREFRDRYLEKVNAEGGERLLAWNGKYDVSRQLEACDSTTRIAPSLLTSAAA